MIAEEKKKKKKKKKKEEEEEKKEKRKKMTKTKIKNNNNENKSKTKENKSTRRSRARLWVHVRGIVFGPAFGEEGVQARQSRCKRKHSARVNVQATSRAEHAKADSTNKTTATKKHHRNSEEKHRIK